MLSFGNLNLLKTMDSFTSFNIFFTSSLFFMNFSFLHCPLCKIEIPLITNLFLSSYTKIPYIDLKCKGNEATISLPVERYIDMITNKQ